MSAAKSRFLRYLSSFRLLSFVLLPGSATYGKCAYAGNSYPNDCAMNTCRGVFGKCSSARITWLIRIASSSTTDAR